MPLLVLWARRTKRARVTWSSWSVWAGSQVSGNFTARQSGRRLASKHSCPGTRSRQWQAIGAAVVVAVVVVVVVVVVFGTKTNEAEASWTYKFLTILLSLAGEANLYLCVCVCVNILYVSLRACVHSIVLRIAMAMFALEASAVAFRLLSATCLLFWPF